MIQLDELDEQQRQIYQDYAAQMAEGRCPMCGAEMEKENGTWICPADGKLPDDICLQIAERF